MNTEDGKKKITSGLDGHHFPFHLKAHFFGIVLGVWKRDDTMIKTFKLSAMMIAEHWREETKLAIVIVLFCTLEKRIFENLKMKKTKVFVLNHYRPENGNATWRLDRRRQLGAFISAGTRSHYWPARAPSPRRVKSSNKLSLPVASGPARTFSSFRWTCSLCSATSCQ